MPGEEREGRGLLGGAGQVVGAAAGCGADDPCQLLATGWLPVSCAIYFCASILQLGKGGTCVTLGELQESQA